MKLRILHLDDSLVAVDKPAGFHVHPPSDGHPIDKRRSCLQLLRRQLGREVHPVHRLDRATSGVLLFALDPGAARELKTAWGELSRKTYLCLVRGWMEQETVDRPLKAPTGILKPAVTHFRSVAWREFPVPSRLHPTSRYSLLWAHPLTGRFHQIRRHLAGAGHPIVGDARHGDSVHNRFFRDQLRLGRLWLRAHRLSVVHPRTGARIEFRAPFTGHWHALFDWFGVCPLDSRGDIQNATGARRGSRPRKSEA